MYGATIGIDNVDLDVHRGEMFGFIGPNGAGKSTTIRLLLQLIKPTSGHMHVLGEAITGDHPALRRRIGYMPSEISYYESLTGRRVLELVTGIYDKPLQRPIAALADDLALDLTKRVKTYSLGNRKKLAIIQALIHEPELLVLDEPTSGLDPLIKATFFDMLRERQARGATVFFSTHVLSDVEDLCERVGLIRDGTLFQVANVADIPGRERRTVSVRFAQDGDCTERYNLRALDAHAAYDGEWHTLRAAGDLHVFLRKISKYPLVDIVVERPSLEEVFLDQYKTDDGGGTA